jgi:hypothetical protein
MTSDERITRMMAEMRQAIKVMGDRFGATEEDLARAFEGLKGSMHVDRKTTGALS